MFAQAFNLNTLPFEEHISTDRTLNDERFTHALNRLEYFAEYGLIALMTGPTGVGKSCLINRFLDALPAHRYQPLYLHISRVESAAMLRMIVAALDEKPSLGKDRLFRQMIELAPQRRVLGRAGRCNACWPPAASWGVGDLPCTYGDPWGEEARDRVHFSPAFVNEKWYREWDLNP